MSASSYDSAATNRYIRSVRPSGAEFRNFSSTVSTPTAVPAGTSWQTVTGSVGASHTSSSSTISASTIASVSEAAASGQLQGTTRNLSYTAGTVTSVTDSTPSGSITRSASAQLTASSRNNINSVASAYVSATYGSDATFTVSNIRNLPAQTQGTWVSVTGSVQLTASSTSGITSASSAADSSIQRGVSEQIRNYSASNGSPSRTSGGTATRWVSDSVSVTDSAPFPYILIQAAEDRARAAAEATVNAYSHTRNVSETITRGIQFPRAYVTVTLSFERRETYTLPGGVTWTRSYSYEKLVETTVQNPGVSFTVNISYQETIEGEEGQTTFTWDVAYSYEQEVENEAASVTWSITWSYERLTTRTISSGSTIRSKEIRAVNILSSRVVAADGTVVASTGQQGVFGSTPGVTKGTNLGRGYVDVFIRNQQFSGETNLYGSIYASTVQLYIVGTGDDTFRIETKPISKRNQASVDQYGEFPIDLGISFSDEETTGALLQSLVDRLGFPAPVYTSVVPIVSAEAATVLESQIHDPVDLDDGRVYRYGLIQHRYVANRVPDTILVFEPDR